MNIYINNKQDKLKIDNNLKEIIDKIAKACLMEEGEDLNSEISISFVEDNEIRELNKDYRGKDSSTDVLSFPMEMDFPLPNPILGDIIISTETALRQAKEYNHSIYREISFLLIHSMFHLMGYDHIEDGDKKEMRAKEKLVLDKLKIDRDFRGELA